MAEEEANILQEELENAVEVEEEDDRMNGRQEDQPNNGNELDRINNNIEQEAPQFAGLPEIDFNQWVREFRPREEWDNEERDRFLRELRIIRGQQRIQREEERREEERRREAEPPRDFGRLMHDIVFEEMELEEMLDIEREVEQRGGGAVTEEMIEEAQTLKAKDESDPSSARYSRACLICATENPRQRAVFTHCGHIVCYSCAVDNARSDSTNGKCVFCRSTSGFVKLFEEEYGNEKEKNDVIAVKLT